MPRRRARRQKSRLTASARKQIDDMRKRIANEADDANLQQLYGTAVDIRPRRRPPLKPWRRSWPAWRPAERAGRAPEGSKEAPDVAAQRLSLETSRRGLDAQIKLAKLLSVDAGQTAEQVSAQLRTQFKARLGERRDAFLSGQFWNEFKGELPRDRNASARCETISMKPCSRHPPGAGCCWRALPPW